MAVAAHGASCRDLLRSAARWLVLALATICAVGCAALPTPANVQSSFAIPSSEQTTLGRLAKNSSPDPSLTGVRLLPTGPYGLGSRIALAERAERTLDVQYYLVQNDATGRYFLLLLKHASSRGVRVRLLIDDMYTAGMDEMLIGLASYPNVEVRLFNPFSAGRAHVATRFAASALDFYRVNHRMHNKLLIADGAMAIVGGRNIADSYFARDPNQNFADLDALLVGAVVPQLSAAFDEYWNSEFAIPVGYFGPSSVPAQERRGAFDAATAHDSLPVGFFQEKTDVLGYGPIVEELDEQRIGLIWGVANAWVDPTAKVWNCRPIPEGSTAPHLHTVRLRVEELLRNAREEVTLSSPYFVPAENGMAIFGDGVREGVSFKVLTNSLAATDEPLVHWGYMRYRKRMLRMGVELYELSPTRANRDRGFGLLGSRTLGTLHAKTAVIDHSTVFIGSMNFDPRSDALNTEIGIVIESPQLARELRRLMNLDKLQSAYRVRLSPKNGSVEWVGIDDFKEVVWNDEPDADLRTRMYLWLVAPFVSEGML